MPDTHAIVQADRLHTAMDLIHAESILCLTQSIEHLCLRMQRVLIAASCAGNVGAARLGRTSLTHRITANNLQQAGT